MVGGTIIKIAREPDNILLTVQGKGSEHNDVSCIRVVLTDLPLAVGDSIWWQDRKALWTPADRSREDVPIERIGFSFTPKEAQS